MITLECDNRKLVNAAKYTFLTTNYPSGISTINVLNATDPSFAAGAYMLMGQFGSESTEIRKIQSINQSTGEIILSSATNFAHPESSRITIIPYNQVRFFWTNTTTFSVSNPLTGFVNVQASDWFTSFGDESHASGYGWYAFYNDVTNLYSQPSNYIPYTGFDRDTVEDVLNDFFSLLNNRELKIISRRDALSWLNEGYSTIRNKLNVTNVEFTASESLTLTVIPGVIEYELPADFDHLTSLVGGLDQTNIGAGGNFGKFNVEFIPLREAYSYIGSTTRYYIRGKYLGFLPTPTQSITYQYMYLKKSPRLSDNSDQIVLPNNGSYAIKDWMMYRAKLKGEDPSGAIIYQKSFKDNLDQMIIASVKRDANLDTWGIERSSNV